MSVRVYVPRDSAALSVGAEGVARAIASEASSRGLDVTLVRNGSRGMFWLEPLVEVETPRRAHRLRASYRVKRSQVCSTQDFWKANRTHCVSGLPKRFPISSSRSD